MQSLTTYREKKETKEPEQENRTEKQLTKALSIPAKHSQVTRKQGTIKQKIMIHIVRARCYRKTYNLFSTYTSETRHAKAPSVPTETTGATRANDTKEPQAEPTKFSVRSSNAQLHLRNAKCTSSAHTEIRHASISHSSTYSRS